MKTSPHAKMSALVAMLFVLTIVIAAAQDAPPSPAAPPPPPVVVEKSLLDLFLAGGALMWPILLCSIGTIAVGF
jgi:hypothetical protein